MKTQTKVIAGILGGLLVVVLALPILVGGTGSWLFTMLFWVLALILAATLIFAITNRPQQR